MDCFAGPLLINGTYSHSSGKVSRSTVPEVLLLCFLRTCRVLLPNRPLPSLLRGGWASKRFCSSVAGLRNPFVYFADVFLCRLGTWRIWTILSLTGLYERITLLKRRKRQLSSPNGERPSGRQAPSFLTKEPVMPTRIHFSRYTIVEETFSPLVLVGFPCLGRRNSYAA
jgi:hypothetical protein